MLRTGKRQNEVLLKITCCEILFCKIIGSCLFIQSGEERQSRDFFYLLRCSEDREGTWDSIIAVIGDGAKSELAGVRKFSLLTL